MSIKEIGDYKELEEFLSDTDWQRFEEVVGQIFRLNGYEVKVSEVVTFENNRRQYDVIAEGSNHYVVIDCKKWDKKREKKSGLRKAVRKQVERTQKLELKEEAYLLVILSCKTPIKIYKKVPIVPIQKLNTFLLNFRRNKERILKV